MRRNVYILTVANIISKPVGLMRQMIFAVFYGVSMVMGSFRFAQTIAFVFMEFFTVDILTAGFLPMYERYKKESPALAHSFFWCFFILLSLLSFFIFILLYVGAPWIVYWFAPGFSGQVVDDAVQFIQVFAYAVPFCLLGTLLSYLAMSGGSFFGVSSRAIVESIGLTLGVLYSVWCNKVAAIAWAFVLTYVFFFLVVLTICYRMRLMSRVKLSVLYTHATLLSADFWETVRPLLMLPLFLQGKFIIEKMLASLMAVSVVASLDYARFIIATGINVLAMPVSLLGLVAFSALDADKLRAALEPIVQILLFISVPITLFLVINSKVIVAILYGYGVFDMAAINEASTILWGMSLAFFANVVSYFLVKVLSSQLKNKRVMRYLGLALFCNILFILLFFRSLGPLSLGIGESLYAAVVFVLCAHYFGLYPMLRELATFLVPASVVYAVIGYYLASVLGAVAWHAFFYQAVFFMAYWMSLLMSWPKTRQLFLSRFYLLQTQ